MSGIGKRISRLATFHRQGSDPNFFIFATPRSGSTWLAELLATQGRYKIVNEPLNLRKDFVRENLGISEWVDLLKYESRPLIRSYLQSFVDGNDRDVRYRREKPFTKFWHPRTNRIIFKMLFGGEDDIQWYSREFGGRVIHLLRHPIAVAQSREEIPRLGSYLTSPYADNFSPEQLRFARQIVNSCEPFQMRILDWCLQNAVPLRHASVASLIVTYEQLVLQPEVVIEVLAKKYALPRSQAMIRHIYKASRSTGKSHATSQKVLRDEDEIRKRRTWLIDKWRDHASEQQIKGAFDILAAFGLQIYTPGQSLPAADYLVRPD